MDRAEKRFRTLLKKIDSSGISDETLKNFDVVKKMVGDRRERNERAIFLGVLGVVVISCAWFLIGFYNTEDCLFEFPFDTSKVFREPVNCDICVNVTRVDKISDVDPEDFDLNYASVGRPVIITDGTRGWKAMESFDFDFFKSLYESKDAADEFTCQFFPYKTEFASLRDVFAMDSARARLEEGTRAWYVGWSNCDDDAGRTLREFYESPYFLPKTSESIALNWIFMGGAGSGAHMHVDDVAFPSWQAQIRGRKTWRLAPPPECLHRCRGMEVTVEPGEIIVLDTNRWYHQTNILPGSISITIGSEFD